MDEKKDETLFGWIHISDIHFGHGDASHGWDQDLVMGALRRDIGSRPAPVRVDAIFVTGDIAFSGAGRSDDEYTRARKWLLETGEAAGVKPERIFLVPGNHDVNRGVDSKSKSVGRLIKALRSRGTPEQGIDDALKDAGDRKLLASRMERYLDFAKDFGPWAGQSPLPPPEKRLYWVDGLDAGGLRVRLVGLNTALLSKDDDDPGQLRLGNEQLATVFAHDRAPNEIVLVLSHHPLRKGWLGDEGNADAYVRANAQAHLSGHVHEAESEEARSGSGESFLRLTAGAAHNDQLPAWIPQTHGYSFGEVRRGERGGVVLRVHPRLWARPRFVLDVKSVPGAAGGQQPTFAEHPLAITLPDAVLAQAPPSPPTPLTAHPGPEAARPSPRSPETGPVRIFFSYAPEDESYRKKLQNHLSMMRREGLVQSFSSHDVRAGGEWKGVVAREISDANVILLLLSDDYLASDYCYDVEMEAIRKRQEAGEALVIPVWLRELDLAKRDETTREEQWFEKLQRVPRAEAGWGLFDGKPVQRWDDEDTAWTAVAREIRAKVKALREGKT